MLVMLQVMLESNHACILLGGELCILATCSCIRELLMSRCSSQSLDLQVDKNKNKTVFVTPVQFNDVDIYHREYSAERTGIQRVKPQHDL